MNAREETPQVKQKTVIDFRKPFNAPQEQPWLARVTDKIGRAHV